MTGTQLGTEGIQIGVRCSSSLQKTCNLLGNIEMYTHNQNKGKHGLSIKGMQMGKRQERRKKEEVCLMDRNLLSAHRGWGGKGDVAQGAPG